MGVRYHLAQQPRHVGWSRAIQGLAHTPRRGVLANDGPLAIHQHDAIQDALNDGIQLLRLHAGGPVEAGIFEGDRGLSGQAHQQIPILRGKAIGQRVAEQQPSAHLAIGIQQWRAEEAPYNGMTVRHATIAQSSGAFRGWRHDVSGFELAWRFAERVTHLRSGCRRGFATPVDASFPQLQHVRDQHRQSVVKDWREYTFAAQPQAAKQAFLLWGCSNNRAQMEEMPLCGNPRQTMFIQRA
ncbi:MAG TPA: hypothetical protein VGR57_11505, partial [Ktedonobacterales bacterium]|nr:hypothetical protein [Ktedonobacterales bacterium]